MCRAAASSGDFPTPADLVSGPLPSCTGSNTTFNYFCQNFKAIIEEDHVKSITIFTVSLLRKNLAAVTTQCVRFPLPVQPHWSQESFSRYKSKQCWTQHLKVRKAKAVNPCNAVCECVRCPQEHPKPSSSTPKLGKRPRAGRCSSLLAKADAAESVCSRSCQCCRAQMTLGQPSILRRGCTPHSHHPLCGWGESMFAAHAGWMYTSAP